MHARRILSVTLAVLIYAAPVTAQTNKFGISLFGGSATYSNMATGSGGIVRMANGWLGGLQMEVPFGRLGLRLNSSYTDRKLMNNTAVDLNVYTSDLDLMFRLLRPKPGRVLSPYIALGGGGVLYNVASKTPVTTLGGEAYGPDPVFRPTVMGALGIDIGNGPVALRLELSDIVDLHSPLVNTAGNAFGPVQHVAASAGLSFRIGHARPAPMRLTNADMAPNTHDAMPSQPADEATQPAPATPQPAAVTPLAAADQPSSTDSTTQAQDDAAALAARFNAWDKVEALEIEIAQLKRRVGALEHEQATAQAASQAPTPPPAPAAALAPAAASTPAPASAHGKLYTVQIASYLDAEAARADKAVAEMKQHHIPVWVTRTQVRGRMVNRVRVGALPSESAARSLGRYINRTFNWPTWVTPVAASDPMPAGAVAATRAFLKGANE